MARLRAKYKLSTREAAERLDISASLLKRVESETRRVPAITLVAIEDAFRPPGDFVQLGFFENLHAMASDTLVARGREDI